MRQRLVFVVAGAIAIAMAGCASETATVAPSPATSPSPAAGSPSPTAAGGQKTAAQPFAKPLLAQKPPTPAVPGLIQPTNPDERAKQVQANINAQKTNKDPFSNVQITLLRPTNPQPAANSNTTTSNRVPVLPRAPQPGRIPSGLVPFLPSKPIAARPNKPGKPGAIVPSTPPPPPSTDLARGVEVSGVVFVNGRNQAIVKAPDEGTSRYVSVGQRLSGGQVLVKRIEMNSGSDPVVVLEENGVEVAKVVGEKVPQASSGNSNAPG
jgi:hypothetical protein